MAKRKEPTQAQDRLRTNLQMLMHAAKWRGTTQGEVARKAKMNPASLSQLLRGRRPVTLVALDALAPVLGTTTDEILQCDLTRINHASPLSHRSEFPRDETHITDQQRAEIYAIARLVFSESFVQFQETADQARRAALHRHARPAGDQDAASHAERKPGA
jgi:transcriptional regulator with XRE-family HTH domain